MASRPLLGQSILSRTLGRRVRSLQRWVMDLGGANDEFGHGVTTLDFDGGVVTLRPGPNEDFIVVEEGSPSISSFNPEHWSFVDLSGEGLWTPPQGEVDRVDLFTDGVDDVAVLLHFSTGEQVVIALVDTDLVVAHDISVFDGTPDVVPRLRKSLRIEP